MIQILKKDQEKENGLQLYRWISFILGKAIAIHNGQNQSQGSQFQKRCVDS